MVEWEGNRARFDVSTEIFKKKKKKKKKNKNNNNNNKKKN